MAEILPRFFKTKNYSSFLRNLNKYGFRKVGGLKEIYENKDFRRKRIKDIAPKKQDKKKKEDFEKLMKNYELLMEEKERLEKKVVNLTTQNKSLHKNNEGLFLKLNTERKEFKIDLSNMMTLFFNSVKQQNPDLINIIKTLLLKNKILTEKEKHLLANSKKFISLIPLITEKIIEDKSTKNDFFNQLIDLFYDKMENFKSIKTNIREELERIKSQDSERQKILDVFKQSYRFDSSESKNESNERLSKVLQFYSEKVGELEQSKVKDKKLDSILKKHKKEARKGEKNTSEGEMSSEINKDMVYNNEKISKSL